MFHFVQCITIITGPYIVSYIKIFFKINFLHASGTDIPWSELKKIIKEDEQKRHMIAPLQRAIQSKKEMMCESVAQVSS